MTEAELVLDRIRFKAAITRPSPTIVRLGDKEYYALVSSPFLEWVNSPIGGPEFVYGLLVQRAFKPEGIELV